MKQILKKEARCFRCNKSARAEINAIELKKYVGKKVFVKVFALDKKRKKILRKKR